MRLSLLVCLGLLGALSSCSSGPAGPRGIGGNSSGGSGAAASSGAGADGASGGTAGATSGGGSSNGTGGAVGPGTYALPPPSQCHNQDYIDYQEGCIDGDTTSKCGGKCTTINACLENSTDKPHADVTFICPRFMLYSAEMKQAAIDDGNSGFNYAVAGHDVDRGGIDGNDNSTCCQCYQLVFAYPSPNNERQVQQNPDNPNPPASAIPLPPPLIVQSFNTAATATTFDIYMAAGGLGANNACSPTLQPPSRSGQYLYTAYPPDGQPSQGGVKAVSLYPECKTSINWVTTQSLSSDPCQSTVAGACSEFASDIPGLAQQAKESCTLTNSINTTYHLNWSVYVMKVECPEHLTQVTGCKLAAQGLPAVDKNTTTPAQAAVNSNFRATSSSGGMYETTTMEDCCRPSCASMEWVSGRGLATDSQYNAFYACNGSGVPYTE